MPNRTPLYEQHLAARAKMVDFSGWEMPIQYKSQLEEHRFLRHSIGIFDVSHMGVIDVSGQGAAAFLRYVLANNIDKLTTTGKAALYTCMLNENAGIVDDLMVYKLADDQYRLIVNAGMRETDLVWLKQHSQAFTVSIQPRPELCIIAIQGPDTLNLLKHLFPPVISQPISALKPFSVYRTDDMMVAYTGYTGEVGIEIILPIPAAQELWEHATRVGVPPCGLGARDTLRLEAGLNLYGSDMNEHTHPLESNLGWTVAWEPSDRVFIGRTALTQKQSESYPKLVGLVLEQKGVLRNHQTVITAEGKIGEITSGSFSPTLQCAIALARIPDTQSTHCLVEIRQQQIPARIVKPPFVRHGKKLV